MDPLTPQNLNFITVLRTQLSERVFAFTSFISPNASISKGHDNPKHAPMKTEKTPS